MLFPPIEHDSNGLKYKYLVRINGNPGFGGSHERSVADNLFEMRREIRPNVDTITLWSEEKIIREDRGLKGKVK